MREADAGAASDRVVVPAGTYTLAATLQVSHPLTLEGAGASATAIDGNGQIVLRLLEGATAVRGVTVRGGDAQGGGGLLVESGASLTLEDAVVSGNDAFTGGGGIYVKSGGAATIRRTSITGNHATGAFGGGIWNQGELDLLDSVVADNESNRAGGIRNEGEMRLRNVTVSTNRALSPEAGVGGISQNGFAFLNNVTITLNHGRGDIAASFRGGGIQTSAGELTVLVNSVVAANDGHGGPADCVGDLSSDSRYNLIGVTTACGLPAVTTTWKLGVDARLGALANNGSPIRGHLPQATSPLVNAGAPYTPGGPAAGACEGRDARGILRLRCDIGALEREVPVPATITLTSTVDQPDAVPGDGVCATAGGACTLRAAIQEANRLPGAQNVAIPAGAYVLSVAGSEAGPNADAAGDLDLRGELTLTGAGAAASVVDGNALGRILDLEPAASVRLVGLTLHNGRDAGGGAIRATSAQLTIEQAVLSGNVATGPGGAVLMSGLDEVLVVLDSTFQGNRATGFGGSGGAVSAGDQVTVTSSTFAANQAAGAGGALAVNGSLLLERSTVRDNRAEGGALGNGGGVSATQAAIVRLHLLGQRRERPRRRPVRRQRLPRRLDGLRQRERRSRRRRLHQRDARAAPRHPRREHRDRGRGRSPGLRLRRRALARRQHRGEPGRRGLRRPGAGERGRQRGARRQLRARRHERPPGRRPAARPARGQRRRDAHPSPPDRQPRHRQRPAAGAGDRSARRRSAAGPGRRQRRGRGHRALRRHARERPDGAPDRRRRRGDGRGRTRPGDPARPRPGRARHRCRARRRACR